MRGAWRSCVLVHPAQPGRPVAVLLQSGSVTEDDEAVPGACEGLHSSIRPFLRFIIASFRSFILSIHNFFFFRSCILSLFHSFILPFIRSFIHFVFVSFILSFPFPFFHASFMLSFFYTFIHSFIRSFSFVRSNSGRTCIIVFILLCCEVLFEPIPMC